MGKRLIISEEERKNILNQHKSERIKLHEQSETYTANKIVQCFLNKKGITDDNNQKITIDGSIGNYPKSKSAQAIFKYQSKIGVETDGVWGRNTMEKMPPSDKKIYDECTSEYESLIDKGLRYLGF